MAVSISEKGNLQGEAGGTGKKGTGAPKGATGWTLDINDNSQNPSKQSLVRERVDFGCSFGTLLGLDVSM